MTDRRELRGAAYISFAAAIETGGALGVAARAIVNELKAKAAEAGRTFDVNDILTFRLEATVDTWPKP